MTNAPPRLGRVAVRQVNQTVASLNHRRVIEFYAVFLARFDLSLDTPGFSFVTGQQRGEPMSALLQIVANHQPAAIGKSNHF